MSPKTVVVALSEFCECDDNPHKILQQAGFNVLFPSRGRRLQREEIVDLLREADAVLAGVEPYDAQSLKALPRLRLISRCGAGTDAIDLEAARHLGITVCATPEETTEPVAQMTLAMILALARNFPLAIEDQRRGEWKKRVGSLLSEWTVGLIGFGRIGRWVHRYLLPLSPRILVTDPALRQGNLPDGAQGCPLLALLAQADLVSLHVDRRPDLGALIGRNEIEKMKPGSRLVNTARGYLVDEAALVWALNCGHLSAAALDVYETEPYTGPLGQMPNVLCTPHVASFTRTSRAAMELRCAQNVVDFFARGVL